MTRAVSALVGRLPRHAVLAALCAGLLLGPRSSFPGVVIAAAVASLLAPRRALAVALCAALVVGAALAQARTASLSHSVLARAPHAPVSGVARLQDAPRASPYGFSALARLDGETVLLRMRGAVPAGAAPGDLLRIRGTRRPAGGYARGRGAHVEVAVEALRPAGHTGGVVGAVRRVARRALAHGLPPTEAALHRGMVLGDDSALPDATRQEFRAAGLTHLVAASGANVALLAALAVALARAAGLGLTTRWAVAVGLIVLYVPLAGDGPSIRRAGVMGIAGAMATIAGRPASRGYALLLAAVVTLVADPHAAADPGWQLSFAAVAGLMALGARWAGRLREAGLPGPLAEATAITAAATLATAPLIALHFGRVSLVALPANVLAAPLVAPVMWLGALAVLAEPLLPAAAALLDGVAAFPLACLVAIAHGAARVPGAQVGAGPVAVLLVCIAVVALAERRALTGLLPARRRGAAVLAGTCLLALTAGLGAAATAARPGAPGRPAAGRLRLSLLDVGQGDAILAQEGTRAVLVDAGPPEADIAGLLRRAGVRRLDLLVITHAETDHAGGAARVLTALPVGAVLDGRDGVQRPAARAAGLVAAARGVRRIVPDAGMVLRIGRMRLRVLSPHVEPARLHAGANPNDRAIVMELDAPGARVLLPADAESPVTLPLHLQGPVDVLKVAHHGSADPGLAALLAAWRPRIAVISVGRHNTFGHPTAQALGALARVPVVLRTDRGGTVRLDRGPNGWEVRQGG